MEPICYYEYSDLTSLIRTYPKRCASHTQGGIPCEYYTVPRQHKDHPAGFTGYTYRYDISDAGNITRIGIRYPQYTDPYGNKQIEPIHTFNGKYSPEVLKQMHYKFIDTNLTYDQFASYFPFGHNATQDAYTVLKESGLYQPNYPDDPHYLWFIQTSVRRKTITFCFQCDSLYPISLCDILINTADFNRFRSIMSQKLQNRTDLLICINSDIKLYKFLQTVFPTAKYCYDMYGFVLAYARLAELETNNDKQKVLTFYKRLISKGLTKFFKNEHLYKRYFIQDDEQMELYRLIMSYELEFETMHLSAHANAYRESFVRKLEIFFDKNINFFDDYFSTPCFHYPLPQHIINVYMRKIAKPGSLGINRIAYIMLSIMRNISDGKYINDPLVPSKSMFGVAYTHLLDHTDSFPTQDLETLLTILIDSETFEADNNTVEETGIY